MIDVNDLISVLEGASDSDTAEIVDLEKAAVAFIETQTRRYFGPLEQYSEVLRGKGERNLWLTNIAVDQIPQDYYDNIIVSVVERNYPGGDGTPVTDFEIRIQDGEARLVRLNGGVWTRDNEYTVTYWRGYAANDEPADIRQLVTDLVSGRWNMRGAEGLKSESIGGYSYTRFDAGDLEEDGLATLNAWRRLVIA